jgi:hypothetical protein
MYSVQCAFGVPKDFPQGSTHDGLPRARFTPSFDAPTCTLANRLAIKAFRTKPNAVAIPTSATKASTETAALCLIRIRHQNNNHAHVTLSGLANCRNIPIALVDPCEGSLECKGLIR